MHDEVLEDLSLTFGYSFNVCTHVDVSGFQTSVAVAALRYNEYCEH